MHLVLDTNVVIDWLVFDDPFMHPLRRAVRAGGAKVLSHPHMADELQRVLAYRALRLSEARQRDVHERYLRETTLVSVDAGSLISLPKGFPRCRDRDDDEFLAFAYLAGADALVSRDKAVLSLKRRAKKFGLDILDVQELNAALEGRSAEPS